ncbi:universal stress protein [Thermodesulfobacteriota bacterium]
MIPVRILFCSDFSENSSGARKCAREYATAFGAELLILHVINSARIGYPSMDGGVPTDVESALHNIQESVEKALKLVAEDCCSNIDKVSTHTRIGIPDREIVSFADEKKAHLIVLGTHGWTGLKHVLMGSVAEHVIRTANCPVLTVKTGLELP